MITTDFTIEDKQAAAGTTADGVQITHGLIVFTNELGTGKINLEDMKEVDEGWFDVVEHNGRRVYQNRERVATTFQGRSAADEYTTNATALSEADLPLIGTVFIDADSTVYRVALIDRNFASNKLRATYDVMGRHGHSRAYDLPETAIKVWPIEA